MTDIKKHYAELRKKKLTEMCKHMRALIEHCEAVDVRFGGCGDCGSPWLTCSNCPDEPQVDYASDVWG